MRIAIPRSPHWCLRANPTLLAAVCSTALLTACGGEVRDATDEPFGSGQGGTSVPDADSEGDDEDTDGMDDADTGSTKLDLGDPVDPTAECASISQTTTIDERPADIIMVGTGDAIVLPHYDFRWWVSELPYEISQSETSDARVFVVVGGAPAAHLDDDLGDNRQFAGCSSWYCGPASPFEPQIIDAPIGADDPLQELLDSAPQWLSLLRPEARKHIFYYAEKNTDASIAATDFVEEMTGLDQSFGSFAVHAMVHGTGVDPAGAVRVAAELTGGLYDDGSTEDIDAGFFPALLERIKESQLACEYDIPDPPDGFTFKPDEINVEYDEGMGLETIGYVASAADCTAVGSGWYYDDADAPTKIMMCPFTCDRFDAAANATIDIKFGCATVPAG